MSQPNKTLQQQQLRIIAGKWRHRKISFYADAGARPTLDRIRETVFNWLTPYVPNANCLDLFAGSGVLGIEALSRGANSTCFIDNQAQNIKCIQAALSELQHSENSENTPSMAYYKNLHLPRGLDNLPVTATKNNQFDIIFLDPPYHTDLLQQSLVTILKLKLLTPKGIIYFEAGKKDEVDFSNWEVLKHKSTKSLQYGLLTTSNNS